MTAELKYSHTIGSNIAQNCIVAVGKAVGKRPPYMGGGLAVQFSIPRVLHRPTRDLDIMFARPVSYPDFRTMMRRSIEYLRDTGYEASFTRHRSNIGIHIEGGEQLGNEEFNIQAKRQTLKHYRKHSVTNEREYYHSDKHTIAGERILVSRAEDLILRKLHRALVFLEEYNHNLVPWSANPEAHLRIIKKYRQPLLDKLRSNPHAVRDGRVQNEIAIIRQQADMFDIGALLQHTFFDPTYFERGFQEYPLIGKHNDIVSEFICKSTRQRRYVPGEQPEDDPHINEDGSTCGRKCASNSSVKRTKRPHRPRKDLKKPRF